MEYRVCSKCVMDSVIPDITFDADGVCNYCKEYAGKEVVREREAKNLQWLYHSIKKAGQGGKYDCIIGLSGGVDSSLSLHYLVENGIRPFTFSIDNGWNTKASDENIMRLVEGLKVPFYRYVLDQAKFKDLQAAFMISGTKNIEIPTDHVLYAATYEMAKKYGVRHIISGGNLATEGTMPKSYGYQARDLRFIKDVYRKATGRELTGLPMLSLPGYIVHRFIRKIKVVNLLDYYEYNREDAKRILSDRYGWKDYGEKHEESVFTAWFQNFYLPSKFNLDKRKPHYSSLIHSGQMTRKEAMDKLLEAPVYPELGIEQRILQYPKRSYREFKNSEFLWNTLGKVYGTLKR